MGLKMHRSASYQISITRSNLTLDIRVQTKISSTWHICVHVYPLQITILIKHVWKLYYKLNATTKAHSGRQDMSLWWITPEILPRCPIPALPGSDTLRYQSPERALEALPHPKALGQQNQRGAPAAMPQGMEQDTRIKDQTWITQCIFDPASRGDNVSATSPPPLGAQSDVCVTATSPTRDKGAININMMNSIRRISGRYTSFTSMILTTKIKRPPDRLIFFMRLPIYGLLWYIKYDILWYIKSNWQQMLLTYGTHLTNVLWAHNSELTILCSYMINRDGIR